MNNTGTEPSFLELAKQGNAKAIAALMNRQLQPKGITAKAALKDGCLQVMLESAQALNQQALVAFVRKGITNLEAASIKEVKVYWHRTGENSSGWSQEFEVKVFLLEEQKVKPAQENLSDSLNSVPVTVATDRVAEQIREIKLSSNDFVNKKSAEISIYILRLIENNKQASQAISGFLCLLLLFGGCVQIFKPLSCEAAREDVEEAQRDYDANYQHQLNKNRVDTDTINSMVLKQAALSNAENKRFEACKNEKP